MNTTFPPATVGYGFAHRHLLGIEPLQPGEIAYLLDRAAAFADLAPGEASDRLAGSTVINLFYENSTRTRSSFEIAAQRLGADVVNMDVATSSVKKGETLIDTADTLNA
ncbi:MAG: aspartate carbamoyltransferase catalytic subunit, partial [Pseudomonadota bacterium]|nr:aspartate carbamoyltransferase catalytic subunit [Pseudomonadota bacterium]